MAADDAPTMRDPSPAPRRLLRSTALNPAGYQPLAVNSPTFLVLGDLLFHSPGILGSEAQRERLSCQACHFNGGTNAQLELPDLSNGPGTIDLSTPRFTHSADNGVFDAIRIPSLRGVRFTSPYGHDGRVATIPEFIQNVVVTEFGGKPLTPSYLLALTQYVIQFDFLPNTRLDANARLLPSTSAATQDGERLFHAPREGLGGRSCAACHVPDTFFRDGKAHLHGGTKASPHSLDGAVETPTLLGTSEFSRFWHDGRFQTLAQVVAWYDENYGLRMSQLERDHLSSFLHAIGAVDQPIDDRPLGFRISDTFIYLDLLCDGQFRDDRAVWRMALDLVYREFDKYPTPLPIADRVAAARETIHQLAGLVNSGCHLADMRQRIIDLRPALITLAADWAGAIEAADSSAASASKQP